MKKDSIAICFVEHALEGLRKRHLDADAVLVEAGISPALLGRPQARISSAHYSVLWRLIALALDDEFFGLDSRRMKVGSFAMLCHSVIHCKSGEQALQRALRFFALLLDDISGTLVRRDKLAQLTLHDPVGGKPQVFAHETLLVMLHGLLCWLVGRRIPILAAGFAFPEPAHSAEYHVMYSTQLAFGEANTSITFDAAYLDLPVVQNERTLKEFLRTAPQNILLKYKNSNSLTVRIRKRLRGLSLEQWPPFEELAAELHMSPSTFRRRLDDEGLSYQSIKDQLRRDLAIDYLCHSSMSVADIATALGFAEPSAFHRAFKKWTGARPSEYRRRLNGAG